MALLLLLAVAMAMVTPGAAGVTAPMEPRIEAVFDDIVPGGSADGGDEIRIHYANKTLANMNTIVANRVQRLMDTYCGRLTLNLAIFANEHGPVFGLTNETKPGFDAFDVAQRVLLAFETADGFPVVSDAAETCRETVHKTHTGAGTPKKQFALWTLVCMAEKRDRVTTRTLSVVCFSLFLGDVVFPSSSSLSFRCPLATLCFSSLQFLQTTDH